VEKTIFLVPITVILAFFPLKYAQNRAREQKIGERASALKKDTVRASERAIFKKNCERASERASERGKKLVNERANE